MRWTKLSCFRQTFIDQWHIGPLYGFQYGISQIMLAFWQIKYLISLIDALSIIYLLLNAILPIFNDKHLIFDNWTAILNYWVLNRQENRFAFILFRPSYLILSRQTQPAKKNIGSCGYSWGWWNVQSCLPRSKCDTSVGWEWNLSAHGKRHVFAI